MLMDVKLNIRTHFDVIGIPIASSQNVHWLFVLGRNGQVKGCFPEFLRREGVLILGSALWVIENLKFITPVSSRGPLEWSNPLPSRNWQVKTLFTRLFRWRLRKKNQFFPRLVFETATPEPRKLVSTQVCLAWGEQKKRTSKTVSRKLNTGSGSQRKGWRDVTPMPWLSWHAW